MNAAFVLQKGRSGDTGVVGLFMRHPTSAINPRKSLVSDRWSGCRDSGVLSSGSKPSVSGSRGSPVAAAGFTLWFHVPEYQTIIFFCNVFSFLSEHSMFSDLHFPALIICSADQFSCLEVQQDM